MPKSSKKFDFSGYATKTNTKCTDGRVILKNAFVDNDGAIVPLIWQHSHNDPTNVLGHALLENREDGVYAYCSFNDTEKAIAAKKCVEHGDVEALSIHANQLKEHGSNVSHGNILEVSLVLAGANPGAIIDNLVFSHGDGTSEEDETDALIFTVGAGTIKHSDQVEEPGDDETVEDVFNTLTDKQKNVVYYMLGKNDSAEQNNDKDKQENNKNITHSGGGNDFMKNNIFDGTAKKKEATTLTHAQFSVLIADAQKGGSLKAAVLSHATEYGIENIDVLFPEAQTLADNPEWLERETGWVPEVLAAIHKSPFSRVKSVFANMNFEQARAKGYIKGTEKKEVYLKAAKRVTTPCTVYVKQKLDRDDIIDIVDFDAVAMVRRELRVLLDEELAVAALVGDGRTIDDEDKISEENIRPIWTDEDTYSIKEKLSTATDYAAMIEEIAFAGERYKGTGSPVFYTTNAVHTRMLWVKDTTGRRIYETDAMLCAALGVSAIKEIPQIAGKTRTLADGSKRELKGIKVNLRDYNFGADKGGQIASFDDFDIDFNQYKYLLETRCSGALTKAYSAQIFEFETKAPN